VTYLLSSDGIRSRPPQMNEGESTGEIQTIYTAHRNNIVLGCDSTQN